MMTLWELLQKEYIPSAELWKDMWIKASKRDDVWDWVPIDKVRIKKIKIDKSLFDFQNEVDEEQVSYMIENFEEEVWQPIHVNHDYYLLDGQHRLNLARRTGMKYIDVIMEKKKDPVESKRVRAEIERKERIEKELYIGL